MNYLLSASILLFAVWPMYHLLLRYSENYGLNRFLLLLAIVVVVALPFVSFTSPVPEVTETLQGTIRYVEEASFPSVVMPESGVVELENEVAVSSGPAERLTHKQDVIPFIYCLGVLLLALLMAVRLLVLLSLHLRSRPGERGHYRILHSGASSGQAFTFGRTLYFSADVVVGPDFDHVLAHEKVHARQGHSLDVFLSELFLCIFWFHPAAWWLRAKMRANLEFLVDKAVISAGADRRDYQLALVRQSQATHGLALTLPFSEPSLKSRIVRMTGMPEYRVVGIIATVALLFWLGMAAMVVKGTEVDTEYNTFPLEDVTVTLKGQSRPISATEFLYATYSTQSMPEEINSFELYFRRLPTPDEYLQIKSILQRIPHTNFSIYEPCNGSPGAYIMQLSHYLKQEAVFRNPLREGDLLPYHFLFTLQQRTTTQPIPDDLPLDSYGYYDPAILSTAFRVKETGAGLEYFDGVKTYPITNGAPKVGEQFYEGTHASELGEEELAVFINGERFDLLRKPDIKFEDAMQYAGFPESNTWVGVQGKATDPNALPNSLGLMPDRTVAPPNARMACLLGMEGNPEGMVRTVHDTGSGSSKSYQKGYVLGITGGVFGKTDVESHPYVRASIENDNILFYLNDEQVTKEDLRKADLPPNGYLHSGRNSNIIDGPLVFQVITDSSWRY